MWTSFLRGFLVYSIVLGIEDIGLGIYYAFKRKKIEKLRWLWRGISWIAIAALGFWLMKHGWLDSWDRPGFVVLAMLPAVTMWVFEIYIKVRREHRPFSSVFSQPEPPPQPRGNVEPATIRIALLSALFSGLFALQAAVVFSVVSPELLGMRWWALIVALVTVLGFAFGMYVLKLNRQSLSKPTSHST